MCASKMGKKCAYHALDINTHQKSCIFVGAMHRDHPLIKALLPFLRPQLYHKGQTLWLEGDKKGTLVLLQKGRIKVYRTASNGSTITLFIMKPHDILGFLPLIDNKPYPASAEALDDVKAMVMGNDMFNAVIQQNPDICIHLLKFLARYLRQSFEGIIRLSSRSALTRVASSLMGIVEETSLKSQANEHIITLPVAAKEYAQLIGLTPESLSRKLTELSKFGIIEKLGNNRMRIIDISKLAEYAEQEFLL